MGHTRPLGASQTDPASTDRRPHDASALVALSGELLAHIGADGLISAANPAWEALLGRPAEGARWIELVHPEDRGEAGGLPDGLTCRMLHADGGDRTVQWRFAAREGGAHAAGRDITPVLRAQAELQDFAYIASHDLAEPLRMVTSYLELLQRRYGPQLDDTADEFIGYAVGGAVRMKDLIDGLLAFSRVGTHDFRRAEVDLGDLATHVLAGHERHVAEAGARVAIDEPLPAVAGDPVLLGQLLGHLITNALKFRHPERPAEVALSARANGDGVHIEVADNGIGIPEQHHDRIFKPFARLHGRDEYGGTGIGLAVCRRIAERHDGWIAVASEPGTGSRFEVWLPR